MSLLLSTFITVSELSAPLLFIIIPFVVERCVSLRLALCVLALEMARSEEQGSR